MGAKPFVEGRRCSKSALTRPSRGRLPAGFARLHPPLTFIVSTQHMKSGNSRRWGPLAAVIAGALVVALIAGTFWGRVATWFAVAGVASLFEQNYGDVNAPLNQAAAAGDVERFSLLAKERTNRKQAGFPRTTAKVAAQSGRDAILQSLIDQHGWDANQPIYDHSPHAAIDYAVEAFHADTVDFLLRRGAKLHIAKQLGEESRLARVCDRVPEDKEVRRNALRIARHLISAGEPMRVSRGNGPDPLYLAIRSKFPEMVGLLLQSGVSLNGATGRLSSPVEFARTSGCEECERLLVAASSSSGR